MPSDESERWMQSVIRIRSEPALRQSVIRSVVSSLGLSGLHVDRSRSELLLEDALAGPPLVYPGKEESDA